MKSKNNKLRTIKECKDCSSFISDTDNSELWEQNCTKRKKYPRIEYENWAESCQYYVNKKNLNSNTCFMGDCQNLYADAKDPCEDEEAKSGIWGKCHEFKEMK